MAYNQNFPANAYQPNLTSYPLLRPADVNPPVPPSISGPGPDRFAPRRGGYRGARGGPSNPRNALSSNRGGSTEGQRMQDDSSRFSDRSEGRDPGYGGASGYSNIEIGPNSKLCSSLFFTFPTCVSDPPTARESCPRVSPLAVRKSTCYRLEGLRQIRLPRPSNPSM